MWAFPAALVIASFGPFAITAALWILADAPARRLSRWWALPAALISYVWVPVYAIRRSGVQRFTAALILAIALGGCIFLSGRVDWTVGKHTYLSVFLWERGVPYNLAHLMDPSNPTPLMLLIWFLLVAVVSIAAARKDPARGPEPTRSELLLATACAVVSAAGWVMRPAHYEESARLVASTLAMLLATFAIVILQRATRAQLGNARIDRWMAVLVAVLILRALATPNHNGFGAERLRSMSFDLAPIRHYALPLAVAASWIATGVLILIQAATTKRLWMPVGIAMATSGAVGALETLHILTGRTATVALNGAQVLLCAAAAAVFLTLASKRSDRDIIIAVAGRDTE